MPKVAIPVSKYKFIGTQARFWEKIADWQIMLTLTYKAHIPLPIAHDEVKKYLQFMSRKVYGSHFRIVLAWEQQLREVFHYHVLIAPIGNETLNLDPVDFEKHWPHGHMWYGAKASRYRKLLTAELYLSKHEFNTVAVVCPRFPQCRRLKPGPCKHDKQGYPYFEEY